MVKANIRRIAVIGLAVLVVGTLLVFGIRQVMQVRGSGTTPKVVDKVVTAEVVPLNVTPLLVQEMAHRLASSRVGFMIAVDKDAYLAISTGDQGEKIVLDRAMLRSGNMVDVLLREQMEGSRLLVVKAGAADIRHRMLRYNVDAKAIIPTVVNPDNVPPVALPAKSNLVAVEPRPGGRVAADSVLVTGFARLGVDEQFSITIQSGNGTVLAQKTGLVGAALTPDWGSFAVTLALPAPSGGTGEATVVIANEKTGETLKVPVRLGK